MDKINKELKRKLAAYEKISVYDKPQPAADKAGKSKSPKRRWNNAKNAVGGAAAFKKAGARKPSPE